MRIRKMNFSSLAAIVMVLALVASSCSKESIAPEEASSQMASPQLAVSGCWVTGANQSLLSWFPDMATALNNCYPEDPDPCAILGNVTTTKTGSSSTYANSSRDKNFINGLLDSFKTWAHDRKPVVTQNDPAGTSWIIQSFDLGLSVTGGGSSIKFTYSVTYRRVTCPLEEVPKFF